MYFGSPTLSISMPITAALNRHAARVGGAPCGQRVWPGRFVPVRKACSSEVGVRRLGTRESWAGSNVCGEEKVNMASWMT